MDRRSDTRKERIREQKETNKQTNKKKQPNSLPPWKIYTQAANSGKKKGEAEGRVLYRHALF